MNSSILLVQLIDGEELCTNHTKAFTDTEEANEYFCDILKKEFRIRSKKRLQECLDSGYYMDTTHFCVEIKEIVLRDSTPEFEIPKEIKL